MAITGAGSLIHNRKKVLLVFQKVSQLWSLPKGVKLPDESNLACWKRELSEETGIKVLPYYAVEKEMDILRYNVTVVRLFTSNLPRVSPQDEEIVESRWVPIDKVFKYKLNAVTRIALQSIVPADPFKNFRSCRGSESRRGYSTRNVSVFCPLSPIRA